MCGRFTLYDSAMKIKNRFNAEPGNVQMTPNYNAAPGQMMPVIIQDGNKNKQLLMKWGYIPHWAKDIKIGYRLINSVSETCFDKPVWKNAIRHFRCLVPANGFYEWKNDVSGKKQPFYIYPKENHLFAFAGVWSTWHDAENHEIQSFSIMTTRPNKEMAAIHNRMPVMLTRDEEKLWLDPNRDDRKDIENLLLPYQDNKLEIYEVSPKVNNARNNSAELIQKISV